MFFSSFPPRAILAVAAIFAASALAAAQEESADPTAGGGELPGIYIRLDDLKDLQSANHNIPDNSIHDASGPAVNNAADPATDVDEFLAPDELVLTDGVCCCGSDYWGWTVLPEGIIYRSYLAGVTEPRMALHVIHVADNDDEPAWVYDGTLGGRKGLIRYGNRNPYRPEGFQIDVAAAAQVRLNFEENMDVQATDYRVGVPFTYGWCNKQIKFGYWHVSSHLGDEFMIRNVGAFTRYNYAKDSVVFGYSEYLSDEFRVYGEASWAFWSDVAEEWEFQFGFEYAPRCPTGIYGAPFFAFNANLREEVDFGGNFVAETGWAWRADEGAGLLRIGVLYYNGQSSQRSFYNQSEEQIGLGIWYDY